MSDETKTDHEAVLREVQNRIETLLKLEGELAGPVLDERVPSLADAQESLRRADELIAKYTKPPEIETEPRPDWDAAEQRVLSLRASSRWDDSNLAHCYRAAHCRIDKLEEALRETFDALEAEILTRNGTMTADDDHVHRRSEGIIVKYHDIRRALARAQSETEEGETT